MWALLLAALSVSCGSPRNGAAYLSQPLRMSPQETVELRHRSGSSALLSFGICRQRTPARHHFAQAFAFLFFTDLGGGAEATFLRVRSKASGSSKLTTYASGKLRVGDSVVQIGPQGLSPVTARMACTAELRGTAYGMLNLSTGVAFLAASVIAGILWDATGPQATFLAGAGFAALALSGLLLSRGRLEMYRAS